LGRASVGLDGARRRPGLLHVFHGGRRLVFPSPLDDLLRAPHVVIQLAQVHLMFACDGFPALAVPELADDLVEREAFSFDRRFAIRSSPQPSSVCRRCAWSVSLGMRSFRERWPITTRAPSGSVDTRSMAAARSCRAGGLALQAWPTPSTSVRAVTTDAARRIWTSPSGLLRRADLGILLTGFGEDRRAAVRAPAAAPGGRALEH
jgi:hypothetical protein